MAQDIALTVNGGQVSVAVEAVTPLLDVLRNRLDLKGARYGCGLEQCGSCMVLLDGEPIYACSREIGTVAGRSITTIEGLGSAAQQDDAASKLELGDIVEALDKHLCRCGAHPRILRAVEKAAAVLREGKGA